jgi:DNA-3-methyladenine glycosylase
VAREIEQLLRGTAPDVARRLLGCILERQLGEELVRVKIVETEAYDQSDVASHSYKGRTPRTDVMFGPSGHLYVYFTYGMHYCCNVVIGDEGHGAAVLIRAAEPLNGISLLEQNRHKRGVDVTNGPAKLCQALAIDTSLNGHDLCQSPLRLVGAPQLASDDVRQSTRIGISRGTDALWRFYIRDSPFVSR